MKLFLLLVFVLFCHNVIATESDVDEAKLLSSTQAATPVKRKNPNYPSEAALSGQEGWVMVSFVVNEQGEVEDPIIEDSSGLKTFERAAMRAVTKWEYSPATQAGKPIQQCQNRVLLEFSLEQYADSGVRNSFRNQYKDIINLIQQGELNDAAELLQKFEKKSKWNMVENAWFWKLDAIFAAEIGDKKRQLKSLTKALRFPIKPEFLDLDSYTYMRQSQFSLYLENANFTDALQVYGEVKESGVALELVNAMEPIIAQIKDLIDSDKALVRTVDLSGYNTWSHTLARSRFSLENVTGDVSEIEIRCDNSRNVFSVKEKAEWRIPLHWGACMLYVEGGSGKSFDLVELPVS